MCFLIEIIHKKIWETCEDLLKVFQWGDTYLKHLQIKTHGNILREFSTNIGPYGTIETSHKSSTTKQQ